MLTEGLRVSSMKKLSSKGFLLSIIMDSVVLLLTLRATMNSSDFLKLLNFVVSL